MIVIGINYFKNYSSALQCVAKFCDMLHTILLKGENMIVMLILHALILHSDDNIEILPNPSSVLTSLSSAERCGTHWNATCQPKPDQIPHGKQSIDPATQYDYKNTMINPQIHCKSKNKNTIQLQQKYGVNILASHKCGTLVMYHCQLWYISYVPQFEPLM